MKDFSNHFRELVKRELGDDTRVLVWFRRQLSAFDPNHESPLGVEPPSVTWPLSTGVLNDCPGA